MLTDLITESLIQLNVEASDREDAITKAATPLVNAGKIEERYIKGIIKALHEVGPYFVLAPQIALPHARSEEGALANAIGITTLKTPITFGNESNDPVQYIFTLSAVESGSHLEALASLAGLFEEKAFFEILDHASDPKEIIDYLNKR